MLYLTPVWCDVTHDMKDAERGQSQAAYTPGKREPETGNDLRNPHRWDTRLACCQVPWHTRGERRTTGPEDCEHAQKGSHDAKEELLQNQKCGHTAPILTPRPKRLRLSRAAGTPRSCTRSRAPVRSRVLTSIGCAPGTWRTQVAMRKNNDPPHPDRLCTRPACGWSLCGGRGERRRAGHLRLLTCTCRRSEATESRCRPCRMAAAHGADKTSAAVQWVRMTTARN